MDVDVSGVTISVRFFLQIGLERFLLLASPPPNPLLNLPADKNSECAALLLGRGGLALPKGVGPSFFPSFLLVVNQGVVFANELK